MENTVDYFYRVSIMDVLGKLTSSSLFEKCTFSYSSRPLNTRIYNVLPQSGDATMGINDTGPYILLCAESFRKWKLVGFMRNS